VIAKADHESLNLGVYKHKSVGFENPTSGHKGSIVAIMIALATSFVGMGR
jgi:hypothetical protein